MAISRFSGQTAAVKAYIGEIDASGNNAPRMEIVFAVQLLFAIANAENIFSHCLSSQGPLLEEKTKDFDQMIECLRKTGCCSFDLFIRIRHSVDSGTSDGTIPKLYAANPQHIVPKKEFTVQFFAKLYYADPKNKYDATYQPSLQIEEKLYDSSAVVPINADHHQITFKATCDEDNFQEDRCSQFFVRVFVPYQVGPIVWRTRKTAVFEVPIRFLPKTAGTLGIREVSGEVVQHKMAWEEERIFEVENDKSFIFSSFDRKEKTLQVAELLKEAEKTKFFGFSTNFACFMISFLERDVNYNCSFWKINVVPPVDL